MSKATTPNDPAKAADTKADELDIERAEGEGMPPTAEPKLKGMDAIKAFRAKPSAETEAEALAAVRRCGPLVLDGHLYREHYGRLDVVDRRPKEPEVAPAV